MKFSSEVLRFDVEQEIERLSLSIRGTVRGTVRRKGAVVAVCGGINSSPYATLCTRALGKEHVHSRVDSLPDATSSNT